MIISYIEYICLGILSNVHPAATTIIELDEESSIFSIENVT